MTAEMGEEVGGGRVKRVRNKIPMPIISVHVPEQYIKAIDELVRRKRYPSRAEAIRMAIRDFILEEFSSDGEFRW